MSSIPMLSDCVVEVDRVTREQWAEIIDQFTDATIYQSWSYGLIRWSEKNISHILIKRDNEVLAAAQLRIVTLPFLKSGIAYLPEGPLWHHRDRVTDVGDLIAITRAIIKEYVRKRGLYLRVIPSIIDDENDTIRHLLEKAGLQWQSTVPGYRTLLIDLSLPIAEIRKRLRGNWRGALNKAEKNEIQIVEGDSDELYSSFSELYKEMHQRKQFKEFVDIDEFKRIQRDLESRHKFRIITCRHADIPTSAIVVSALGSKGIYLLGATSSRGMKLNGSHLLQWKAIEWMKMHGCKWYDLGGIDPIGNKGTYYFKAGLSGKAGKDVHHIGQFDLAPNLRTKLIIRAVDMIRRFIR